MNRRSSYEGMPSLTPHIVASQPELMALLDVLRTHPIVAVDTESNSLYAYQERVCLIQISISGADYLVDPLADVDVTQLAEFFADSGVQKVFHAAEYDVMCLKRDYGFRFANLFDTMWAARILGWARVGLGDILKNTFDVSTNKRYQRYNWSKRPLDPQALQYACLDTHYLLALRERQAEALHQAGRWGEALEVFHDVAASDPMPPNTFDPEGFWRVKGAFDLSNVEQAVLRELYAWRDREACRQDRPPFKVVGDRTLNAIAQARPHSPASLKGTQGIRAHHIRRYGEQIVEAVRRGERSDPPRPLPAPRRRPQAEVARFQALRNWRKRVAASRGVDPDVVVSNALLWAVAERKPKTTAALEEVEGFGPWKRKAYGEAILEVLRKGR